MLTRVVSGGQTGVDRAGLDAAIELGIPHGGWVPVGRRAEDGPLPLRYQMRETADYNYAVRTERNVIDSDGTLIITRGALDGGTALTAELAGKHCRPLFVIDSAWSDETISRVLAWIVEKEIRTLNVAGPRESKSAGIYEYAKDLMRELLMRDQTGSAGSSGVAPRSPSTSSSGPSPGGSS